MIEINLNKILKEKNMSLYRLEKKTKLSHSLLWRYNKGAVKRVDLGVLDKLCKVLKCSFNDLFEFKEDKTESAH